jgi:hypothetical protein
MLLAKRTFVKSQRLAVLDMLEQFLIVAFDGFKGIETHKYLLMYVHFRVPYFLKKVLQEKSAKIFNV